jgi:hypothetical protein
MTPELKKLLSESYGLDAAATDEQATAHLSALPEGKQKEIAEALGKSVEELTRPQTAQMSIRKAVADAGDEMLALEGKRVAQLQQLGNTLAVKGEVVALAIAEGDDVIKARTRYLKHLQEVAKPIDGLSGEVRVGADKKVAMLQSALCDAIRIRAGQPVKDGHEEAKRYAGLSVLDMFRHYLAAQGVPDVHMLSRVRLAELLGPKALRRAYGHISMLAMSTSDFDNILLNASNKTLQAAYAEAKPTWTRWARRNTAPDFKAVNRVILSAAGALTERKEGQPINYSNLSDHKETYYLAEYTNGVRLTRQALVNDDLDAFGRLPRMWTAAAVRKEDDVAYAVVTTNASMGSPAAALFHADHDNLVSGTANCGAPTVTTVAASSKLMRIQTGLKAEILDLSPSILLCPVALDVTASQLIASLVDPSKSNATPNPYSGRLQVVSNARLDANSAVAWYLLADPSVADTVEVCFLQDEPTPVLKQEADFDTDDVKFAVRHTVAAAALDFRGMVKNPGTV